MGFNCMRTIGLTKLAFIVFMLTALGLGIDTYNTVHKTSAMTIGGGRQFFSGLVENHCSSGKKKDQQQDFIMKESDVKTEVLDMKPSESDMKPQTLDTKPKEWDVETNQTDPNQNQTAPTNGSSPLQTATKKPIQTFNTPGKLNKRQASDQLKFDPCTQARDLFFRIQAYDLHRAFLFMVSFAVLFSPLLILFDAMNYKQITPFAKLVDLVLHSIGGLLLATAGLCLLAEAINTNIIAMKGNPINPDTKTAEVISKRMAMVNEDNQMAEIIIGGLFSVLGAAASVVSGILVFMLPVVSAPTEVPPSIHPSAMTQSQQPEMQPPAPMAQ